MSEMPDEDTKRAVQQVLRWMRVTREADSPAYEGKPLGEFTSRVQTETVKVAEPREPG